MLLLDCTAGIARCGPTGWVSRTVLVWPSSVMTCRHCYCDQCAAFAVCILWTSHDVAELVKLVMAMLQQSSHGLDTATRSCLSVLALLMQVMSGVKSCYSGLKLICPGLAQHLKQRHRLNIRLPIHHACLLQWRQLNVLQPPFKSQTRSAHWTLALGVTQIQLIDMFIPRNGCSNCSGASECGCLLQQA
jgi:hypothetical protein